MKTGVLLQFLIVEFYVHVAGIEEKTLFKRSFLTSIKIFPWVVVG